MTALPSALIAEDELLLAEELRQELGSLWPDLRIDAVAQDGLAALEALETYSPSILFLDVRMPGLDGLEIARHAGQRCHIVFITAYDEHAVAAFEAGAVDYLLKPLNRARLAKAVSRLKARVDQPPADLSHLLARIAKARSTERLRFITVLKGREIQFITIDEICYFKADHKYVAVVTVDGESLISRPLKDLMASLDPEQFWQVHRSTVVNIDAVKSVYRTVTGELELRLKGRDDVLKVGPSYASRFTHM